MSSVRPKLAPQTPKIITAWDTKTGRTLYRTHTGDWNPDPDRAQILTSPQADTALAEAQADQIRANDPYLMEVSTDGEITGRETLRERMRAFGPSFHPHLGRQANNG